MATWCKMSTNDGSGIVDSIVGSSHKVIRKNAAGNKSDVCCHYRLQRLKQWLKRFTLDKEVKKHFERQRMNENKKTNKKAKDNACPSSIVGEVKEKAATKEKVDFTSGPSNRKEKLNEKDATKKTWLDKLRVCTYVPRQIDATLETTRKVDMLGYRDLYKFSNLMAIADFDHYAPIENKGVYMHNHLNDLKEEWLNSS
ncbi:hypothetical protein ACFE04_021356 [Oxalis oulophora]